MPEGASGGATTAVFDGVIQNALGTWGTQQVKPLIVSMTEGWPPPKEKLITEVAAQIYASNDCPVGQENVKAWRAVNMAEQLYSVLRNRRYVW